MRVLVTGIAGYVGAHVALRLIESGHSVFGVDRASRGGGRVAAVERAASGAVGSFEGWARLDLNDGEGLAGVLEGRTFDAAAHLAASCVVGESVRDPEKYRRDNVDGTAALLGACGSAGVGRVVFASSTAVYGDPGLERIPEGTACAPINPYGATKLEAEGLVAGWGAGDASRGFAALRLFNVAGCDARIGEQSRAMGRLVPAALDVARGELECLTVHGAEFPTRDGTAVRDYVDARDVARAFEMALGKTQAGDSFVWNVGRGVEASVLDVVASVGRVTGRAIGVETGPRRAGDPAFLVADVERIERELGWRAAIDSMDEMVGSAWGWIQSA